MIVLYCSIQFACEKAAELEAPHPPGETPPKKKLRVEGGNGGEGAGGEGVEGGERGEGGEGDGGEGGGEVDRFLTAVSCLPLAELGPEGARVRLADMVAKLSSLPHIRKLIDSTH